MKSSFYRLKDDLSTECNGMIDATGNFIPCDTGESSTILLNKLNQLELILSTTPTPIPLSPILKQQQQQQQQELVNSVMAQIANRK